MNRLILIGNGFDLAHGIKTSYHDFILDYLKISCIEAIGGGRKQYNTPPFNQLFHFKDELIEVKIGTQYDAKQLSEKLIEFDSIHNFNDFTQKYGIEIIYDFKLLQNGIKRLTEYNWVDFEIEYFDLLIDTKNGEKKHRAKDEIIKLNSQFDFLKEKLEKYLEQQQKFFINSFDRKPLVKCFTENIYSHEIVTISLDENQLPENLFFLNFNYTSTFEDYFDLSKKKYHLNLITYMVTYLEHTGIQSLALVMN